MKRILRCVCVMLVMAMLVTIPVFAAESVSARASYYFACSRVYLERLATYTFKINFDVTALDIMDELGVSSVSVQRSSDGENWTTENTYTRDERSNFIREDAFTHAGNFNYTGTLGYYYRAKVIFYAKNSTGSAKMTHYSSSIYLSK